MNAIIENWYMIIATIAIIVVIGVAIYKYAGLPTDKQLTKIKKWLLYAVTKAESELGTGTGVVKLRAVYDMFLVKFPATAMWISFDQFSELVDSALDEMKDILAKNNNVKELVENKQI